MLSYLIVLILANYEVIKAKVPGQAKQKFRLSLTYPNP